MNHERLQRIRNFQSQDWYAAIVVRPITILVMLVVADWKFLTPNRLTTLGNLCKLAGAWCVLSPATYIHAVVLFHLGILFDHLDGTVARYRREFTKLGSYYDKVSDMITWAIIMLTVGWQAYRMHADAKYIVFAAAAIAALNLRGYMKWLHTAETERVRWLEARKDPVAAVAKYTAPILIKPPPVRTSRDWAIWFVTRMAAILVFEEMDLWFWLGLGLFFQRLDLVLWLFLVTQVGGVAIMVVVRALWMNRVDRQIRQLEAQPLAPARADAP